MKLNKIIKKENIAKIFSSLARHLLFDNYHSYQKILKNIQTQRDIWVTTQGEYMAWWLKREKAKLQIKVNDKQCHIYTSLENAIIEQFPGEFIKSKKVTCEKSNYSGNVWITIDRKIHSKEFLAEILMREGILNYRIGDNGDFMLSKAELGSQLELMQRKAHQRQGKFYVDDIKFIRKIIIDKLAKRNLPLLRIWYHPLINGTIIKAVFSPRHDVDRAINNLSYIRSIENQYNTKSTIYIRSFCPFYTNNEVIEEVSKTSFSEVAVHGEFITNAQKYGDEYKAASAEKIQLETITGKKILGVGMHGGELNYNRSQNTNDAIRKAGFLYDTTIRPMNDFLPSKKIIKGKLSPCYTLSHALSDIEIPLTQNYRSVFYKKTIKKMNEVYKKNGVFVLMLHPVYFGFFSYICKPKNSLKFLKWAVSNV
jgi:hypothetical protein